MKRAVFFLATLVICWALLELVAGFGHLYLSGSFFPKTEIKNDLRFQARVQVERKQSRGGLVWEGHGYVEALHPYYGFVVDPERKKATDSISELGFPAAGEDRPFLPRESDDEIRILFLGGSFALGTGSHARQGLAQCLSNAGHSKVKIFSFAVGGYKQPQQLHVLADLYSQQVEADYVVNIDGLNEVALSITDNAEQSVNPRYPRRWADRVATMISPEMAVELSALESEERARVALATRMRRSHLYRSPGLALLWRLADSRFDRRIFEIRGRLRSVGSAGAGRPMESHGPAFPSDEESLFDAIVDTWKNSSRQMHHLAVANGATYLHYLQPNQYLADSKPLSEGELENAYLKEHSYRPLVERGYPLLRQAGHDLREAGVNFRDLTQIYSDSSETLYTDACCHVNRRGYLMVADAICEDVLASRAPRVP